MPRTPSARTGFPLAVGSALAFGVLPILAKRAFAEGLAVEPLLAWRFTLGALALWALVRVRAGRRSAIPGSRRAALVGLGALYSINSGLYFHALERIPASATSLLFYAYPALVALIGLALPRGRPHPATLAALALALIGVVLTVGATPGPLDPFGVALALLASLVVATYFVLSELALAGLPTLAATAHVLSGTALAFWVWEAASGRPVLPPGARTWALVLLMALVSTAFSIAAMLAAVRRIGAGPTSILLTLEPVFTVVLAARLLGESLSARQIVGGALILSGVALLRTFSARQTPQPADV